MSLSSELLATMAVIAAGAFLGRLELRGLRLDVAAMLLLGAAVAHFGITLSPSLGLFGLLLFLYTVGVQAGPALRNMQARELKLAALGLGILLALLLGTLGVGRVLGVPLQITLGSFCGFFGSGAALALLEARSDAGTAAAGFAVAAPIGSLLVMTVVQVWRKRATAGIEREIQSWNALMNSQVDRPESAQIVVENSEVTGPSLRELRLGCQVLWVERDGESFAAGATTTLRPGDLLHVVGTQEALQAAVKRLGRFAASRAGVQESVVVRKFFVSNPEAIGVRLEEFLFRERYGATITRIRRAGMQMLARPGFRLRWGDRVQVSAPAKHVPDLSRLFGDDAHGLEEFAFPRAAMVIFVGGLLGAIPIELGGSSALRLGPALGVLVASLITAALHRTGPMVWSQSGPTLRLLSHIGLPLFMAQVGNACYAGLISAWSAYGMSLVLLAIAPVLLIIILCALAGRLLGYGSLTILSLLPSAAMNTPALTTLQGHYRERIPGQVYAAVYPFASLGLLAIVFTLSLIL